MDKDILIFIREKDPNMDQLFSFISSIKSDLQDHCETLKNLVEKSDTVVEFGVRWGKSTICFLTGRPKKMFSYDLQEMPTIKEIKRISETDFEFKKANSLEIEIEPCDILFIDTYHSYDQLIQELKRHHNKVKKYIVMHDTVAFARKGHREGERGLMDAIEEFVKNYDWKIKQHYTSSNGLTILSHC